MDIFLNKYSSLSKKKKKLKKVICFSIHLLYKRGERAKTNTRAALSEECQVIGLLSAHQSVSARQTERSATTTLLTYTRIVQLTKIIKNKQSR